MRGAGIGADHDEVARFYAAEFRADEGNEIGVTRASGVGYSFKPIMNGLAWAPVSTRGRLTRFDTPGPLAIVWIAIGIVVLLAVLADFLPALRRPENPPDDRFWKWKFFYVNPDDPALLVAKRYGIGYTFNFGNPRSWAVLALILVAILAPVMFALHSIHSR